MGFFSCGFKFELSSYGTCKEVIKTSRVQVRRKVSHPPSLVETHLSCSSSDIGRMCHEDGVLMHTVVGSLK